MWSKSKRLAGPKSPVEVSAEILATLRQRVEDAFDENLSGAVITVPAYFDDAQRQATKDAAKLAGIHVLRLLSEPTAAAIAYGLDNGAEGVFAAYDLGGGTFDISILRLNKGVFEVLATGGRFRAGWRRFRPSYFLLDHRTGQTETAFGRRYTPVDDQGARSERTSLGQGSRYDQYTALVRRENQSGTDSQGIRTDDASSCL